ncbi:MAG: heavy metal-associated domain-containing protein [Bacillota bacterium]|nr:heavy metal-associated domain-containing protein [Bacillota bacterium]
MTVKIIIDGMGCENCVNAVKRSLSSIPNVKIKKVEIGRAVVEVDGFGDWSRLREAIEGAGYDVLDVKVFDEYTEAGD